MALDLSGQSVLVVDDEKFSRTIVAYLLEDMGKPRIIQAGNGAEALDANALQAKPVSKEVLAKRLENRLEHVGGDIWLKSDDVYSNIEVKSMFDEIVDTKNEAVRQQTPNARGSRRMRSSTVERLRLTIRNSAFPIVPALGPDAEGFSDHSLQQVKAVII